MTSDLITVLLVAITVVAFIQPNAPRLFAALIFVALTLFHEFLLSDTSGAIYYISAALVDLGIIILTAGINPVPKMVIELHKICISSICINGAGYFMWLAYLDPFMYDCAFIVIYSWALITMIQRGQADVGGFTVDSWISCVRFDLSSWFVCGDKN